MERLRRTDRLDWLLTWACQYVRDQLCPALSAGDDFKGKSDLVERIGREICAAVLVRLRKKYTAASSRSDDALVRSCPKQTVESLELAVSHVGDSFFKDQIKNPGQHLVNRCARVLPVLWPLPNLRGRSRFGEFIGLHRLIAYEQALALLPPRPSGKKGYSDADLERVKGVWPEIPAGGLRCLTREQLARIYACRAMGVLPPMSLDRFRHVLPRLQKLALALNKSFI